MSEYGLNIAELAAEGKRLSSGDSKNFLDNFVRWPDGNGVLIVRFLPNAKKGTFGREKNPFYLTTRTHRLNGRSYHCPKDFDGKYWKIGRCPICDYYNSLWDKSKNKSQDESNALQAEARQIKPVERYYYNVIVRQQVNQAGEVEKNVGPKILSVGKTLHASVIRAILGDDTLQEAPLGDISHFVTGRDFKIIKVMRQSGKDNFPNYSDSKFIDPSPLGDPQQIALWMAGVHDLPALRKLMDYEELHRQVRIHMGLDKDEDAAGFNPNEFIDEDVAPVAKVTKIVATKAAAAVEVEAEEVVLTGQSESLADDDFLSELQKINS